MRILLVRHGKTQGNLEGRYVGRTDEPLLEAERERLKASGFRQFRPDIVYCSRMLRCRQTADILFCHAVEGKIDSAGCDISTGCNISRENTRSVVEEVRHLSGVKMRYNPEIKICDGLEETDFGDFEYKNYRELNGNPAYQAWIDSGGMLTFPGGESGSNFRKRCCRAFAECMQDACQKKGECIAFVVHGGTIMSVMEAFAEPKADFYSWQVKNGDGFLLELSGKSTECLSLRVKKLFRSTD